MKKLYPIFLLLSSSFFSQAQTAGEFVLRSVLIDPPGGNNGYQYVEIAGPSAMQLSNIWFIEIDGHAGSTGKIDLAVNLSSYSTGNNGLLLIRDAATVLNPPPDAPTHVVIYDFNPDLSDQSATFALVTNFTGAVGDDVDNNNDGVLNKIFPWGSVISAVGISDGSAGNITYGSALSPYFGVNIPAYGTEGYDGFILFNNQYYGYTLDPDCPPGGIYVLDSVWDSYNRENIYIENGKTLSPGRTDAALPVKLLSFKASVENENVVLNWTSAATNMKQFEIESSLNGINFKNIGTADAKNTQTLQQYAFIDQSLKSAVVFYRLKMTDKNEAVTYSSVLKVNLPKGATFKIYPNPVSNNLSINHFKAISGSTFRIISKDGKILKTVSVMEGNIQTSIDVSTLSKGSYLIEYKNDAADQSLFFIKQ